MNNSQSPAAPAPALVRAVKQILRPLVGLLLDNGLTYGWLTRILKIIYVDVAEEEFALQGKAQTDSRVSLLSGVHRKDVHRIRNEDKENYDPPQSIFMGARLVALWTSDPRYQKDDHPAPLPRLASAADDGAPSFEELVRVVNKDIRPRAILDEWTRLGAVTIDAADRVCLDIEAFIPTRGFEEKAYYLGKNVHDHLAAARANVGNETAPFLERSVYYDQLSSASVAALTELTEKKAMTLLKEINLAAIKLQQRDIEDGKVGYRMNFGTFFYQGRDDD